MNDGQETVSQDQTVHSRDGSQQGEYGSQQNRRLNVQQRAATLPWPRSRQ
jgi:predicted ThiF/HesA family dinucleotide-utilizing enzyme